MMQDNAINKEIQWKKEYLKGYKTAKQEEKRILEQIHKLRSDKMLPSLKNNDMPHGTDKSDLSDYVEKLDGLLEKLKQERLIAVTRYDKIYQEIRAVEDDRERNVLVYRYLHGMMWEDICVAMGLSWKWVHKIHSDSLKNFKRL